MEGPTRWKNTRASICLLVGLLGFSAFLCLPISPATDAVGSKVIQVVSGGPLSGLKETVTLAHDVTSGDWLVVTGEVSPASTGLPSFSDSSGDHCLERAESYCPRFL